MTETENILEVSNLSVTFDTAEGAATAIEDINLTVAPGEVLGLVGESGSGKSLTAAACLGMLPGNARATGSVAMNGEEYMASDKTSLSGFRGRAAMVFQNPMVALHPLMTIGRQMADIIQANSDVSRQDALARAQTEIENVRLPDAHEQLDKFPHQFSGGQLQRIMIAIALTLDPDLLIADEPTTALDVTVQAEILNLIRDLQQRKNLAVLFITHDLGIVSELCDRVVVVRYGKVVETGTVRDVFAEPQSDYTHALLDAVPALGDGGVAANDREEPILEVRGLTKRYGDFEAVRDVSFSVRRGTCVGLVGESGSGKSTVAMSLLRLNDPVGGAAFFEGDDILAMSERTFHPLRNRIGVVFQNPYSSLNPRMRVRDIIAEPLETHTDIRGAQLATEVEKNIKRVGLDVEHLSRFPTDFSGGQRQRIAIARALALAPDLLILDEPTAALDVSVQAQVLDLLEELQRDLSLTYLFITHDLAVVERLASDVIVMYRGGIMEQGPVADVFANPKTQYTRKLLASVPKLVRQPA